MHVMNCRLRPVHVTTYAFECHNLSLSADSWIYLLNSLQQPNNMLGGNQSTLNFPYQRRPPSQDQDRSRLHFTFGLQVLTVLFQPAQFIDFVARCVQRVPLRACCETQQEVKTESLLYAQERPALLNHTGQIPARGLITSRP